MANLFFKRGLHKNLFGSTAENISAQPLSEGTIYFTTDEGGMYVDTADKRVRIQGSVLYFDTLENFVKEVEPPFSQDVLYFIAKSESEGKETKYDALLRWDGSKWIQLNVTAESFIELEKTVSSHTLSITELQDRLTAIDGGSAAEGSLAALVNRVTAVEETLNGKEGTTGLIDRVTAAEEDIVEQGKTLDDHEKRITSNTQSITQIQNNYVTNETYNKKIEELDAFVESTGSSIGTLEGDLKAATDRLDAIDGTNGRLAGIDTSIENLVKADTAFDTRVENAEGRIENLEDSATDYGNRITALETTVNGTDSVTGLVSKVSTLETTVKEQGTTIDNQGKAISEVQTTIGDFTQLNDKFDSKDITGALNELYDKADGIAEDVNSHTERLVKLENALGTEGEGLPGQVANLATQVQNLIQADTDFDTRLTQAEKDIDALEAADTAIREEFAAADAAMDKAYKEADATINQRIDDLTVTVNANSNTLLAKANQADVDQAIEDLENLITSNIESANAMVFRSDIEVKDEASYILLKAREDMSIGDTIIVQDNFEYNKIAYHAGDLLVAKSTAAGTEEDPYEVDGLIPIEKLDFIQVDTGYVASHNPKLSLSSTGGTYIELKDYVGGSLGSVRIATQSGLTIEADADAANQLNINMTWGEF